MKARRLMPQQVLCNGNFSSIGSDFKGCYATIYIGFKGLNTHIFYKAIAVVRMLGSKFFSDIGLAGISVSDFLQKAQVKAHF